MTAADQTQERKVVAAKTASCAFFTDLQTDSVYEGTWLLSAVPRRLAIFCLLLSAVFPSLSRAQAPVFEVIPLHSSIKFDVKASIDIKGKFDKWNANLTFSSPDETTGSSDQR